MLGRTRHSSTRFSITVAIVALFIAAPFSAATEYPRSQGPVSDYAGKLSPAQVTELTALLEDYERQTSIEIAVVVADSLQDQTAREYAIGIGDSWGVGKAGRNNGVVLLWAPNERAYSLRVAEGLSDELSSEDATDITRTYLLPNFRRDQYYEGLQETVEAIIGRLGNESWEARARRHRQNAWLIAALVGGAAISAVALVALYRRAKRKLKLQEMAAIPESIVRNLRIAEENAPQVQQLLDKFKSEMPEQDLTRLTRDFEEQPNRIASLRTELGNLKVSDIALYQEVLLAKDRAEEESDLLSNTRSKLDAIRQAKTQSQKMMQRLANEGFRIEDVKDGSKKEQVNNLLSNSRSLYDQAYQNSSMSVLDWMLINDLLNDSLRQVQQAVEVSQAEPYTASPAYDASSSSTTDAGSFGSGGDFGGGSGFGGGGGFDGGSGSDGSY